VPYILRRLLDMMMLDEEIAAALASRTHDARRAPSPTPAGVRYPAAPSSPRIFDHDSAIVMDRDEFVLSDAVFRNGAMLELRRVRRVRLSRIVVAGDGTPQHNINLVDCPDAILNDIQSNKAGGVNSNGSRMGHGIHFNGRTGCEINRILCQGNAEDGIQMGNTTQGIVRVSQAHLVSNGEDGCDIKNGTLEMADAVIDQRSGAVHHCVVVHDGDGSEMATRAPRFLGRRITMLGHESSQLIRVQYGFAEAVDCAFWKPEDRRWFSSGDTVYDKRLELDTANLSIVNGVFAVT